MKKKVLTEALACMSVFVMVQENGNCDKNNKIVRDPYETNNFFDNWFVGVRGGVNIYEGEYDSKASFGKRLSPALDISVGKWITPALGVRLQYSGLPTKGLINEKSIYAKGVKSDCYNEKFGVMNLHGDLMWNWSNSFCGYKETRVWNSSPFAGFGWARSYSNDTYENEFAPSISIYNSFSLGKVVDLPLEARQMFVNQRFEGTVGGNKWKGMTSVTVGLSFTGDSKIAASPVALFFGLGKPTLDQKELVNLEFYVKNAIKADKNKIFTLIGSADSATGSEGVNLRLSEQRMQYVYDLLVDKYGIPGNRLIKKAEGDKNNRFSEPALNRSVIIE